MSERVPAAVRATNAHTQSYNNTNYYVAPDETCTVCVKSGISLVKALTFLQNKLVQGPTHVGNCLEAKSLRYEKTNGTGQDKKPKSNERMKKNVCTKADRG